MRRSSHRRVKKKTTGPLFHAPLEKPVEKWSRDGANIVAEIALSRFALCLSNFDLLGLRS
jgi:hypothetical protein